MHDKFVIGIDIGTQGTKTVLFSESGECIASAFEKSNLLWSSTGAVEENPEDQLQSVFTTVKKCIEQARISPNAVAGIAICGQMAGIIGIGDDGKHVTPYDSWLDTRCGDYVRLMAEKAGEEILKKTGNAPGLNHGPKILWWKHEQPEVYNKIKSFVQPGAYVAIRLCGLTAKDAFIDSTYLHFTGFANNKNQKWDVDLCDQFAVDINKLPSIVNSSKVVGELTSRNAEFLGLQAGIPVVAGCGDTAASFLSAGAVEEGICIDVAGTASVFAATVGFFQADIHTRTLGCGKSTIENLWHPYAYINGGGMNLEWFKNKILLAQENNKNLSFAALTSMAKKIKPNLNDPLFVPHLGGRACPSQTDMRGAWINLSWSVEAPLLYRSILESVVLEFSIFKKSLISLYRNYSTKEMRVTGGGEKDELWNQMKADALGIKVVQIKQNEGAPLGVALLAGYGTGLFNSIHETINNWVQIKNEYFPNEEMYGFYKERLEKYRKACTLLGR
jgi:xylulokinase